MSRALRPVGDARRTYREYAAASVAELLGTGMERMRELRVRHFASTVLLNRGGVFEVVTLPAQAQWSPAFGVCIGDFDGDAREDVFLAQNFFGTDAETGRHDAGLGLGTARGGVVGL
jgi:hypothetical protein